MRVISLCAFVVGTLLLLGFLLSITILPQHNLKASLVLFLMGTFFVVLALLNQKNGSTLSSPYISFSYAAALIFYAIQGLVLEKYTFRMHSILKANDPNTFWLTFKVYFISGLFVLAYAIFKLIRGKAK
jgi:hypothetical protein